jgi:glycosyltransferase involved in cell wall biosynthesis
MQEIDILHIFTGAVDMSGLYLHEIFNALQDRFRQEIIVNYYYPFSEGKKYFYKISELTAKKIKNNNLRLFVRFFELIMGLFRTYIFILIASPRVINYNLTSDTFPEFIFLLLLKLKKKYKIIITCHDVVPFQIRNKSLSNCIKKKRRFFLLSDYLLIHNENSRDELKITYDITDKILIHPFPLTDIKKFGFKKKNVGKSEFYTIGMFGHFRKEKGLDILIESWRLLRPKYKDIKLIIGGNFPDDSQNILKEVNNDKDVLIVKSYLSDNQLFDLMQECNVIVLPYKRATNTAFPAMILSIDKLVIASDIPTFKNSLFFNEKNLFKKNDPISLTQKIETIKNMNDVEIKNLKEENNKLLGQYKNLFTNEILAVYHHILQHV